MPYPSAASSEIIWYYLNPSQGGLNQAVERFRFHVDFPAARYLSTQGLDDDSRAKSIAQSILLLEPLQNEECYRALEEAFNNKDDYKYGTGLQNDAGYKTCRAFKEMLPVAREGQKKIKTLERACSNYIWTFGNRA